MGLLVFILTSITCLGLLSTGENIPVPIIRRLNESAFEIELTSGRVPEEISEWLIASSTLRKIAGLISPETPPNASSLIQKRETLPRYDRLKLKDNLPTLFRSSIDGDWQRVNRTSDSMHKELVKRFRQNEQNETSLQSSSSEVSTYDDNLGTPTPSESKVSSSTMARLDNSNTLEQITIWNESDGLTASTSWEISSDKLGYSMQVNTKTPVQGYEGTAPIPEIGVVAPSSNENFGHPSTFLTEVSNAPLLSKIQQHKNVPSPDSKLDLDLDTFSEMLISKTTVENKEKFHEPRQVLLNGEEFPETPNISEIIGTPRSFQPNTSFSTISDEIVVPDVTIQASVALPEEDISPPQINEVKILPVFHREYTILVVGITLSCIGFVLSAGGLLLVCTRSTKESPPNRVELMSSNYTGTHFEFRNPEEEV